MVPVVHLQAERRQQVAELIVELRIFEATIFLIQFIVFIEIVI